MQGKITGADNGGSIAIVYLDNGESVYFDWRSFVGFCEAYGIDNIESLIGLTLEVEGDSVYEAAGVCLPELDLVVECFEPEEA